LNPADSIFDVTECHLGWRHLYRLFRDMKQCLIWFPWNKGNQTTCGKEVMGVPAKEFAHLDPGFLCQTPELEYSALVVLLADANSLIVTSIPDAKCRIR
jgi:hypothetical protein